MNIYDYQKRYERWWLGQDVRFHESQPWKRVTKVKLIGPPSFVYGNVWLTFADGSEWCVYQGNSFRPRKSDVQVRETSPT